MEVSRRTVPEFFNLHGGAVATFFGIDLVWLGLVARPFYQTHLGHLMRANIKWVAAVVDLIWGMVLCASVSAITYPASARLVTRLLQPHCLRCHVMSDAFCSVSHAEV